MKRWLLFLVLACAAALPIVDYDVCADYETHKKCMQNCCSWDLQKMKCVENYECKHHADCDRGDCPSPWFLYIPLIFCLSCVGFAVVCAVLAGACGVFEPCWNGVRRALPYSTGYKRIN